MSETDKEPEKKEDSEDIDISKGRYPKSLAIPLFIASACIPFFPGTYVFYVYLYLIRGINYFANIWTIILYFGQLILVLYGLFWLTVGTSILLTKILDIIVTKKYGKIQLGSYSNAASDPMTMGWRARGIYRKFCTWYVEMTRSKWLRTKLLRMYGIKIGKNVTLGRYILEDPFIEIGNNVFMGKNTIVSGHLVDHNKLSINRTIIGNNCIMDNFTGCVGTIFGDNTIIKGPQVCGIRGQSLKGDGVYKGTPLKKIAAYSDFTIDQLKNLKKMIKAQNSIDYREERVQDIESHKFWLVFFKTLVVGGGLFIGFNMPLGLYLWILRVAYGSFPTWIIAFDLMHLSVIPIILMSSIFFFCVGIGLVTFVILFMYRIMLNRRLEEGVYDLDDKRVKAWKTNYLLKLYVMKLLHHSPFVYTDVFLLQAFRNIISSNVRIVKCFYDPEFLNIGENSECAAFSIIHTHQIKDGKLHIKRTKLGKNVIIGGFAHVGAGVEIGDNTIVGLGAYIPDEMKLEPNSLYIGNPPKRYPVSVLSKKYEEKKRKVD